MKIRDVTVPMKFSVDLAAGTASARPISACLETQAQGISYCPTGFTMIGQPGYSGTYCIHSDQQPAQTFTKAYSVCVAMPGGRGGGLCAEKRWERACRLAPPGLVRMTDGHEWVDLGTSNWSPVPPETVGTDTTDLTNGNGGCMAYASQFSDPATKFPFRCCIY